MMQANQIQERFSHIEQSIDAAVAACHAASSPPADLTRSIDELDRQSDEARSVIRGKDEKRIQSCVDSMEATGDKAVQACRSAGNIDPSLRDAVQRAHSELSSLKHQLH